MTNSLNESNEESAHKLKFISGYLSERKVTSEHCMIFLAIIALILLGIALCALGVFQFFYAERASAYFGLTEFDYLTFYKFQISTNQLPAFGIAGGLVIISLLNTFRYEMYHNKNVQTFSILSNISNPTLKYFLSPIDWFVKTFRMFIGYIPNDPTWLPKILFVFIEAYFIFVALSVAKVSNPIVFRLGIMVAIGLPFLTIIVCHGFAWLFFYVFDYNGSRKRTLSEEILNLEKKVEELGKQKEEVENEKKELENATGKGKVDIDELLEEINKLQDARQSLKEEIRGLKQNHSSLNSDNPSWEQEIKIALDSKEAENIKKMINMNLKTIETSIQNVRDGLVLETNSSSKNIAPSINDKDYNQMELELSSSPFDDPPENNGGYFSKKGRKR